MARTRSRDTTAAEFFRERGIIVRGAPYRKMDIDIQPKDLYTRVPPDGPLSQAWPGVQLINPIASVGTHWHRLAYNPLQGTRLRYQPVNLNNPTPSFFGTGPAVQSRYAQPVAPSENPGLLSSLMRRIRGG